MKFLFNLSEQTLKITHGEYFLVPDEEKKFFYFRSVGFNLDFEKPNHWILFSPRQEKIQVLYKVPQKDGSVLCYKRIIPRPASGVVEVEFSEWDQVKKTVPS